MKKEELQQYQALCIEIDDLTESIEKIQDKIDDTTNKMMQHDMVKGSSPHFPYTEYSIKIQGLPFYDKSQLQQYKRDLEREMLQLHKQRRRAQEQKFKIQEFIYTIQDPQIRNILKWRYIDGFTWLKVSRRLGSMDESYGRKICYGYMKDHNM